VLAVRCEIVNKIAADFRRHRRNGGP